MPKSSRADARAETAAPAAAVEPIPDAELAVMVESLAPEVLPPTASPPDAPPPDSPPPAPAVVEEPRTHFTPAELALITGHATELEPKKGVRFGGGRPQKTVSYNWQHAAAAQLHGWGAHEHHAGEPIQLTRADYEKAIEAAVEPVTRLVGADGKTTGDPLTPAAVAQLNGTKPVRSSYEPHAPALSPHAPKEG
jgi:hypothetical protein